MSLEMIEPPSKEVLQKVRSQFGLNEQRVREAVEHLKEWIHLQPHLPKEIDDGRLERWLIRCENRIEKVKKTLDLHYTLRTKLPDVMSGWDTEGDWFKSASSHLFCFPMPQLTPDGDRVIVAGLLTSDSTNFNHQDVLKLFQVIMEIRMSEDYNRYDIYVFDYANMSLGHVPKLHPSFFEKFQLCGLNGYNALTKGMHVLNAPPHTEDLIGMIKGVYKSKLAETIQVHGSDLTSFYEQVPKEILPTEYGGNFGSVAANWDLWKKKIESYRHTFLEREKHKSDESKRPAQSIRSKKLLRFEGSFSNLEVY